AGPTGMFPLGLRRQAVDAPRCTLLRPRRQLLAEADCLFPGHVLDGMVWATAVARAEVGRVGAQDRFIVVLRDGIQSEVERPRQCDLVPRRFVGEMTGFPGWRPHQEGASGNQGELHCERVEQPRRTTRLVPDLAVLMGAKISVGGFSQ